MDPGFCRENVKQMVYRPRRDFLENEQKIDGLKLAGNLSIIELEDHKYEAGELMKITELLLENSHIEFIKNFWNEISCTWHNAIKSVYQCICRLISPATHNRKFFVI